MARANILPIFVPHLGCPNACVFCDQRRISGSPLPASGRDVTNALVKAREKGLSGLELAFYGGSFTAVDDRLQEELLGAVIPFREDGTVSAVRLSTRPDAVDPEVIGRLRRFGVETVELGAQSMDDGVLAASGRGHTAQDTVNAAKMLKAAGFKLILQMMTGLPGSDMQKDILTGEKIIALLPDGVRIYPTVIVKNTPLEDMWRTGTYKEHTVADAVEVCAGLVTRFRAAHIPVIRLGLNPTAELSGGDAVAGAYHPALGELVQSEILFREALRLLEGVPSGSRVTLGVAPSRVSAMTGQHRQNIQKLCCVQGLAEVRIKPLPEPVAEEIVLLQLQ